MNLIMEATAKQTPLNKAKKGMTLVEVMAAMAILVILFAAISLLMINTVNIQGKSERQFDISSSLKTALLLFDSDDFSIDEYIGESKTFYFKEDDSIESIIKSLNTNVINSWQYKITLIVEKEEDSENLYKITGTIESSKGEIETKSLFISR